MSSDVAVHFRSAGPLVAVAQLLRRGSSRGGLVAIIVASMAAAAAVDFASSAELVAAILLTLPLALCALQPSRRLLWGVTASACALTAAAEFWGFGGVRVLTLSDSSWINRGLLIASLLTLGAFVQLSMRGVRAAATAAEEIQGQRRDLISQTERLEALAAAAAHDVAQRQAADEHLVQMEARYRGLLDAAPDAMVVVNARGEIVLLNLQAEKQFGYRRDELVGHPVTDIIPEGFAERLVTYSARSAAEALAEQIGTGIELIGRRRDGGEFPIELMLSPLESADGVLVTAAIRDGAARRNAVETLKQRLVLEQAAVELMRSNDDLQQFAYVAAHDLREPLRMVSSYTQLLANRYKGRLDADADTYIAFAVDGAERMRRLIEDLLAYCQVGIAGHDLRETSAENALSRALANLKGAIDESGGAVTHDCLPTLVADPAQLTQLFQNIIGNALKYRGPASPRVHVSARKTSEGEWVFAMRDNGLGIDPRYFEKIFLMFQRLHGRSEFSGTGIGLSLCRKIAERHGGRMWVASAPGAGSTFFLALPATRL